MAPTTALTAYTCFMQWFRHCHPELYRQYWQHITAPAPNSDVNIDADGLHPDEFVRLMQVQFEYYSRGNNQGL